MTRYYEASWDRSDDGKPWAVVERGGWVPVYVLRFATRAEALDVAARMNQAERDAEEAS